MDATANMHPLYLKQAYMTFLFPFSFHENDRKIFTKNLQVNQFTFFTLNDKAIENKYYGDGVKVRHEELDQYFLPFLERKLFPYTADDMGFSRFSKQFNESFTLEVHHSKFQFFINSVDITICPFGIGLITIRTEMNQEQEQLCELLDFMNHFRVLEPKLKEEKGAIIRKDNLQFSTSSEFIFAYLCPSVKEFIIHDEKLTGYFGSLPFFEDERMMTSGFFRANGEHPISEDQLFRMGQLDGKNEEGHSFMSSTNAEYINRYVQKHVHNRWAPDSYTVTSEHTQITVSVKTKQQLANTLSQYMGSHYYNLMLHYFYKIMLLRLTFEYSELKWKEDEDYVEELIELITKFSSRYHFGEVSVRSEGKELSHTYRDIFHLNAIYEDVKQTLHELYRAQENQANKRQNMLLFMLTVFTVISGIYGMNLVIEDWKGQSNWSKVVEYSFFEWVSLITALVGISLSVILLGTAGGKSLWKKVRKWKRLRYK